MPAAAAARPLRPPPKAPARSRLCGRSRAAKPEDNSITLPYEFTTVVLGVVAQSDPEESEYEWGEAVGAVDSFIFAHEFGHAPIDFFGRQDPPQLAEYADNHSFDRQRADNILCWIGGAEEELLVAFVENGVLPEAEEGKKSAAEGWGRAPSAFTPAEHG